VVWIRNPRREPTDVKAEECPGGQFVGSPNVSEEIAGSKGGRLVGTPQTSS
jgi:hypothetical protein